MFRAISLLIFRNTRLCVTACGIMQTRCYRPATGRHHRGCIIPQAVTHILLLIEDGQNNCPKHVVPTGIFNKPLLLHLVCFLYYLYQWCTVKQISDNEIYFLIEYTKIVLWRVAKRLSYIEDARCLKFNKSYSFFFLTIFKYRHIIYSRRYEPKSLASGNLLWYAGGRLWE